MIDPFAFEDPTAALSPLFAMQAEKEITGRNIVSFDLPFLARLGFAPTKVFDTALAPRVIHAGERLDHDLAAVVERELSQELDKDQQRRDWSCSELTGEQIEYAAVNATVLLRLAERLCEKAAERKVKAVVDLEMKCVVPIGRMAASGVGFDTGS